MWPMDKADLWSSGPHAPHMGIMTWSLLIGYFWFAWSFLLLKAFKTLPFPPIHFKEKNLKKKNTRNSLNFCFLISIITFSYELEIEWSKSQKCWSWWELQTPSIFRAKWLCDLSLWADFSPRFILVGDTSFSYFHFWSSLLIFLFDWWNVLRIMLVHMRDLYDWLIVEF